MLLISKKKEVLELVNSQGGCPFELLPKTATILVRQYTLETGKRKTFFQPIIRKFIKGMLDVYDSGDNSTNPNNYLIKEDEMSVSATLIKSATENGVEGIEASLKDRSRRLVERALRQAEGSCDFLAMANLTTVLEKFGTKKKAPTLSAKECVPVNITKTDKVPEKVWDMILRTADKVGDIAKLEGNAATLNIKKADSKKFIEGIATIAGISVK